MVIFLAGLRQIPRDVLRGGLGRRRRPVAPVPAITLPLLSPIIFFNLVLQIIHAFQSFTQAFVVSGGTGGPADSTLFYTLYLYQQGFGNFDMGYASAHGLGAAGDHRRLYRASTSGPPSAGSSTMTDSTSPTGPSDRPRTAGPTAAGAPAPERRLADAHCVKHVC